MLNAFTHGKGRRAPTDIAAGESLRKALSTSEDMLTATVFERLGYLTDASLCAVLHRTFGLAPLSPGDARLDSLVFWPKLTKCADKLGQEVEPDVVLRFSLAS